MKIVNKKPAMMVELPEGGKVYIKEDGALSFPLGQKYVVETTTDAQIQGLNC